MSPPASTRVVAIIPVRYASTRLPGKALADIGGRTMIEHVYRRTAAADSIDEVVVATDDLRVVQTVAGFGGQATMTSADHRCGTDRLAEVAGTLDCGLVVNVQTDEPLIESGTIDLAVAACTNDPAVSMSTLRCPLPAADLHDPNVVKVAVDRSGYALCFSRAAIGLDRDGAVQATPPVAKHIGLYVYRRPFLLTVSALAPTPIERAEQLEQMRVLEHGYRIMTAATDHDSIGVDTPADLARVRRIVAAGALHE